MQKRHTDRKRYFLELSYTSKKYYIPYLLKYMKISASTRVLEVGCGEGGNLLPFIDMGCKVMGIDQSVGQIERANSFLSDFSKGSVELVPADFLQLSPPDTEGERFDLILLHDVIEHIEKPNKEDFFRKLSMWLKNDGLLFVGFPPWQMPFGGHQQICKSRIASTLPFAHLLPFPLYKSYLRICGESSQCVDELMSIKRSKMTIEQFENLSRQCGYVIINRLLWFINPHYEVKFGLAPKRLNPHLGKIPVLRNFFTTSCFYLLRK